MYTNYSSVMVDAQIDSDTLTHQCYILTPKEFPSVCKPDVPLSFANVEVVRLAFGERYGMSWIESTQ